MQLANMLWTIFSISQLRCIFTFTATVEKGIRQPPTKAFKAVSKVLRPRPRLPELDTTFIRVFKQRL